MCRKKRNNFPECNDKKEGPRFRGPFAVLDILFVNVPSNFLKILFPAVGKNKYPDANDQRNRAIDRPLDLAGHETAGQDVDALENPDATAQY